MKKYALLINKRYINENLYTSHICTVNYKKKQILVNLRSVYQVTRGYFNVIVKAMVSSD